MTEQPLFGAWRPIEFLGSGSVAETWSAVNEETDERGLLKILRKDRRDEFVWRARFLNEIDALEAFEHPGIPELIEDGMRFEMPYMVVTYFDAKPVPAVAPMSESQTVEWALDVVDALIHVHSHGMIHADVKATNILVDAEGHGFLIDFDMTIPTGQPYPVDWGNKVRGSKLSAPPERFRQMPEDGRSDLFGLGVAMYHSVAGTPMHTESPSSPRRLADGSRERYAQFSEAFRSVMDRLVHPDLTLRFETAEQARDALKGILPADAKVLEFPG